MKKAFLLSVILFVYSPASLMATLPPSCIQAYKLSTQEQFTKAHATGDQQKCPLLMTYIKWMELRYRDNKAGFRDHYAFLKAQPDWPFLYEIRKNMERRPPEGLSDAQLKAWFDKNPPLTGEGLTTYATLLKKYGALKKANQLIRSFWHNNLRTPEDAESFLKHHKDALRLQDHKIRLNKLLWEGKTTLAKPLLSHLKKGSGERAVAQARIALRLNDKNLKQVLNRVPRGFKKDEGLLYDRLRWHRRFRESKALDFYVSVRPHIDTHLDQWIREKHIIVRDAIRHKRYKKAYRLVSSHKYKPGTSAYGEAEWLAGFIAHRFLNNHKGALTHFENLLGSVKRAMSVTQTAYWGAKAQAALGQSKRKVAWLKKATAYPMTYYGQRACRELNINTCFVLKEISGVPKNTLDAMKQHKFMPLITLLKELGESYQSQPFLYLMYKRAKGKLSKLAVVEIARQEAPETMVELLEGYEKRHSFPVTWAYPHLTDIKWRKGIDKALVHAIIRKESRFNPHVKSWAGAIGMMQIMPRTGAYIAKELNVKNYTSQMLYDRDTNLRFGQFYVAESLERFKNNIPLTLAAYNAGHGNVRNKWMKLFGDPRTPEIDEETWIELIPFMETRFYVMMVTGYYEVYKNLNPKKERG